MGTQKHKEGDTVYDRKGRAYEYIMPVGHEHAVAEIYEDEDEPMGDTVVLPRVFLEPPAWRQHPTWDVAQEKALKERTELREGNEALREKAGEMREEVAALTDRLAMLRQHCPAAQRVADFLDGKYTHLVLWSEYGGPAVMPLEEALKTGRHRSEGIKLVTLRGVSEGNLSWGLNDYHNEYGHPDVAIPCFSLAEAQQAANERITSVIAELAADEYPNYHKVVATSEWMDAHGEGLPAELHASIRTVHRKALVSRRDHKAKDVVPYQNALDALDASAEGGTQ